MSGSSIVSSPSLEEGGFNLPRETSVALRLKDEVGGTSTAAPSTGGPGGGGATVVGAPPPGAGKPGVAMVPPPPVFCATLREPLTHKAAVYYHQQLALQEDQGIDLTQSPGRDSPGSSSGSAGSGSRHSTASLDSGRASSYLTGVSSSGASIRAPLSSPRCSSVSSCSIGSVDRQRNDELIIDWLLEMKHEEYAQLFIAAGYDLPTIARMTPEDLTAIGIKNPHHRERIKQRIDKLQVLDNLPHFVPGSIEEWLQLLRLEEYIQPLLEQNYKTVRDVTQVTWEDLEDIGIVKLGHQKKNSVGHQACEGHH
ncbi:GD11092 [Drosophila simulans]|uniref:GD11092 n=1 Tax=Drosophila simulans TaxID=7240 RepID=B4QGC5_DROSI|nr:GD11092 [Drosophila simulans]